LTVADDYEKSNPKLHKLLIKYKDLFRNGIGCLTQKESDTIYKATINTKINQSETDSVCNASEGRKGT
jgi:hypothetical protein